MNLLIVSPLFPPDASASAKYTKELCLKLSQSHTVTVLHFGRLPEQVPGVKFISVPKRTALWMRFIRMTSALYQASKKADAVLMQNGPSIELSALLVSYITKATLVCFYSDSHAKKRTINNPWQKRVHQLLAKRCTNCITIDQTTDLIKPIVHPLKNQPMAELKAFDANWSNHLKIIEKSI